MNAMFAFNFFHCDHNYILFPQKGELKTILALQNLVAPASASVSVIIP